MYSLFVERALRLVRRDGIVGLLVPSGIAADKGASEFFRSISTTGRLAALLDFENRRTTLDLDPFFPDVDSQFKFCAVVAGGLARVFDHADCAFFKQDALAAEAEAFPLAPEDFAAVNPNTGTAPVFRSRRDAEITLGIYRRLPVLVDRRGEAAGLGLAGALLRMFDMTNDSDKFRTAAELERLGAYRVAGQRWEKGDERWLPLYEGKMVQPTTIAPPPWSVTQITSNPSGPARAGTPEQHADPSWSPSPQFWVRAENIPAVRRELHARSSLSRRKPGPTPTVDTGVRRYDKSFASNDLSSALVFKDVTSPTNVRTMIAALVPPTALGNTLPAILPDAPATTQSTAPTRHLARNPELLIFDFVARQKVQGRI